jgi:hypothetical protein
MTHRRETLNSSWGREESAPLTLVLPDDEGTVRDHSLIIDSMARMRGKPRGVYRTVLVDRDTRIFNDRLWAQHDREDQLRAEAAARPAPKLGFLRRLFG